MQGFFPRHWPETFPITDPDGIFITGYIVGAAVGIFIGYLLHRFRVMMKRPEPLT